MGLVFVTKNPTPKAERKVTRLFQNSVRLNTKDSRFSFSETVINKLEEYKENPALELAVGFAYDSEKNEVYLFVADPVAGGLVPGKARSFTNRYHSEEVLKVLDQEDLKDKVLIFDVDLDNIQDYDGNKIVKLTLADTEEPRTVVRAKKEGKEGSLAEAEGDEAKDTADLNPTKAAQVADMWPNTATAAEASEETEA